MLIAIMRALGKSFLVFLMAFGEPFAIKHLVDIFDAPSIELYLFNLHRIVKHWYTIVNTI